jgi:hypothetical protein
LAELPNIQFLYLHANKIESLDGVTELAANLPKLNKLSLHGNPVENGHHKVQGYRTRVIMAIPWLRELDFVVISRSERADGKAWGKSLRNSSWKPVATASGLP